MPRGHAVLQRADRQDGARHARAHRRRASSSALSYTEAVEILDKSGQTFEFPVAWGNDLQAEHERYLTEKHFKSPVILYDYPRTIKPFYMRVNDDGHTVRAMDVLVPKVGEIIGGSQREERLDVLEERMKEQELDPESYWWYLDLRRYGTVPHAGLRPGAGAGRAVRHRHGQHPRRDPLPAHAGQRRFLKVGQSNHRLRGRLGKRALRLVGKDQQECQAVDGQAGKNQPIVGCQQECHRQNSS